MFVVDSDFGIAPSVTFISVKTLSIAARQLPIGVLKKGLSSMDILALIIAVVLIFYLM